MIVQDFIGLFFNIDLNYSNFLLTLTKSDCRTVNLQQLLSDTQDTRSGSKNQALQPDSAQA